VIPSTTKPWGSLSWPNRISILRLLLVAPFVVLVMNQNKPDWFWARHAALGVFAVMAVSDFLDGLLARKLNSRTRLGAILDPLADKALLIFAVVLLSTPDFQVPGHRVENWVVVFAVGKELWIIAGFLVIYVVTDRFLARPTLTGKASTFAMCVMVPVVLLAPELDMLASKLGRYMMLGAELIVTLLCILAVISYTRLGLAFVVGRQKPLEDERKADDAPNEQH
jgi:cardiolipin synthase